MHLLVILLNLYFILVVWKTDELHSHEYVLITAQSVLDLVLTGIIGLIYYLLDLLNAFVVFCHYGGFLKLTDDHPENAKLLYDFKIRKTCTSLPFLIGEI